MITLEQTVELIEMLTGGPLPDGYGMKRQPKLSRQEAFSVIWFIQERLRIIPDHYYMCHHCEELLDGHLGYNYIDDTDEPSEALVEFGITQEMIKEHGGNLFCSSECEAEFWAKIIENARKEECTKLSKRC